MAGDQANAQRRRACLVFFDESALSLTPNVRRSWAPVGQPPVLVHPFNWKKASMAAALCYGGRGGGAQLAFHITAGNYDTLIQVLSELRRFLGGEKATLLWDGLPAHAPELNPVEGLWSSLKAVELANLTSPTLGEVIGQAQPQRRAGPPDAASGLLIPAAHRPIGLMTINPTPQSLLVRFGGRASDHGMLVR